MNANSQRPESSPGVGTTTLILKQSNHRGEEHHSYLLRLWRSGADGSWRASLQSVQTGDRHMFADLDSLLAFLVEQSRPPPAV
ncbi:MAG: hypothetical protein U0350_45900 [Caldilineaceae bacterium]